MNEVYPVERYVSYILQELPLFYEDENEQVKYRENSLKKLIFAEICFHVISFKIRRILSRIIFADLSMKHEIFEK